jgi:hypothetical protein
MNTASPSRSLILLILLTFFFHQLHSQRKADIGIFGGASWYQGDITSLPFYKASPAFGVLYRYNVHDRISFRASAILHELSGNDLDFNEASNILRSSAFNSRFVDLAGTWEFNFLPYNTLSRKTKYTPYVFAGLGYQFLLSSDIPDAGNHFTIPFGVGVKLNIVKRLSAGMECTFHKTFTDNIDGIKNVTYDTNNNLLGNKDWYTFAGIFITYKVFKYREDCPAYD